MGARIGMLSTYPPTQCGIATFSEALVTHLVAAGADVGLVRLVDAPAPPVPLVVEQWVTAEPAAAAAATLDDYDVAVVQHEYGIYGGPDGQDLLDLVARLNVPVVAVLHTVLTRPSRNQHRVMAELVDHAAALVTMTTTARDRLITGWGVDPDRVTVIPHGAEDNRSAIVPFPNGNTRRRRVLTWGLLSEGKGIEWALLGLAELRRRMPLPDYEVVGQTHPRVLEREGEAYRDRLVEMTASLHLAERVRFDRRYLSSPDLREVVRQADVILLPYDSPDQVTSGVLTEAVAAGKPVISTNFPHAVELLSSGAGLLVPPRDPSALAVALERVLTIHGLADRMAATSRNLAASLLWPTVAARYLELASSMRALTVPAAL